MEAQHFILKHVHALETKFGDLIEHIHRLIYFFLFKGPSARWPDPLSDQFEHDILFIMNRHFRTQVGEIHACRLTVSITFSRVR